MHQTDPWLISELATRESLQQRLARAAQSRHTVSWEYDIEKDPKVMSKMKKEVPYVVFVGKGLNLPQVAPAQVAGRPASHATP